MNVIGMVTNLYLFFGDLMGLVSFSPSFFVPLSALVLVPPVQIPSEWEDLEIQLQAKETVISDLERKPRDVFQQKQKVIQVDLFCF